MKLTRNKILHIGLFYIIALVLRYYFYVLSPDFLNNINTNIQGLLTGIGPLVAGLVMVYLFRRPNDIRIWSFGIWQSIALFLVPVVLFFALGYINTGIPYYSALQVMGFALLYACLEEYGWRGYLQTELKELNKYYKYFIISVLWYFWHFDFQFNMASYMSFFLIWGGSVGMGVVADRSKSLILVALFHAFINIYIQTNFQSSNQKAIILIISALAIITWMIVKGKKKKKEILRDNAI